MFIFYWSSLHGAEILSSAALFLLRTANKAVSFIKDLTSTTEYRIRPPATTAEGGGGHLSAHIKQH